MTCCIVGRHPQAADIDRLIRAQRAASAANNATSAPSYSQIARMYDLARPSLIRHRDECLSVDRGATVAGVDGEKSNESATLTPATGGVSNGAPRSVSSEVSSAADRVRGQGARASVDRGVARDGGRATGPPRGGTDRRSSSQRGVPGVAQNVPPASGKHDRGVAVGQRGPGAIDAVDASVESAPHPSDAERVARAREGGRKGWEAAANNAIQQAARNLANATHDIAIHDPSMRAHGTYVEEIAEVVQDGEWEDERTVQRLTRAWNKSRLFVLQCHRDACTLIRIARGTRFEQVESSAARWMNLYKIAIQSEEGARVAAEALKGHDRVLGLVDSSTKVQINIAQSDEARAFVAIFLDEAKGDPALLERIRRRLAEARDRLGDTTAILATADAAE